jgi:hypothetical protein
VKPLRTGVATAIVNLTLRMWFNGLERAFGGSRRLVIVTLGTIAALLLAWLVVGTHMLGAQMALDPSQAELITTPVVASMVALPGVTTTLIVLYTPDRTVLTALLAVLPVQRSQYRASTRWINAGLGCVVGTVWVLPLALQFGTVLSAPSAIAAVLACLAVAVCGAFGAHSLMTLVAAVLGRLLPCRAPIINVLGAVVTSIALAGAFLAALPTQGRVEGEGPFALLAEPLAALVTRTGADRVVPLLVYLAMAVVAVLVSGCLDFLPEPPTRPPGRRLRLPDALVRSPRGLLGLETRAWLRFPPNTAFLFFLVICVVVGTVVAGSSQSGDSYLASTLFLTLASTLGVSAYGITRATHWIYSMVGRPRAWIAPKLLGSLVVWGVLVAVLLTAFAAFTAWPVLDLLPQLPALLVELLVGCIVGLIFPVSTEQSLSTALSETMCLLVLLVVAAGLQSITWIQTETGYVLTYGGAIVVLTVVYVLIARGVSGPSALGRS